MSQYGLRPFTTSLFAVLVMFATACGGNDANLQDAAADLDVPAAFQETKAVTNDGFEATTRSLTFTTELSQADACDLAGETLASWAQQELPDPRSALPRNICSYELENPTNHPGVDLAAARVFRAKAGDDFVEDESAPGGVQEITIFFRTNK